MGDATYGASWLPFKEGTDVANAAAIDFSTVKDIILTTNYRFLRLQSHSGEDLILTASGGAATNPGTPNAGSLRVKTGTAEVIRLPRGSGTRVKIVTAAGGAGSGSALFCK